MSQPFFIFVLPTGNNEIIKQISCLLFSLSKMHSDDDSFKEYINHVIFINLNML